MNEMEKVSNRTFDVLTILINEYFERGVNGMEIRFENRKI